MQKLRASNYTDEAHVKKIVMRSNTSFYWAMRLLARKKRTAMFAIYAFCRGVDDIADELATTQSKRLRLQKRRVDILAMLDGKPNNPLDRQLLLAKERFRLKSTDFLDIIEGISMDIRKEKKNERFCIVNMDELTLYCNRVAGAVGRLSNQVFGLEGENSNKLASALGRALQITNILRDLVEDAEANRLYLPLETLKKHGIKATEPKDVLASPHLSKVCNEIATIAEQDFQDAESILCVLEREKIRPILIMKDLYKPTLKRLIKRGWVDLDKPVRLAKLEKLWIIFLSGILSQ